MRICTNSEYNFIFEYIFITRFNTEEEMNDSLLKYFVNIEFHMELFIN